ncbi:hypothetical protein [Paucibacter soli]|uniref:hypothetical protein n=1 Tax=Paucibacter soli TaxID=3133433 RepID=UPI0030B0E1BD
MGVHLARLQDNEGWRGRTGALSFRRFLQEEGVEPRAAYQYIAVARAFVLEHDVDPKQIALVGMRALAAAVPFLRAASTDGSTPGNVEDVVSTLISLPSAEALETLAERYGPPVVEEKPRISAPVSQILGRVDGLTIEQRSELFTTLRVRTPHGAKTARPQ